MRRRALLFTAVCGLLLAGCSSWWQQQQRAQQQRLAHERCVRQRGLIEQKLALVVADEQALATLQAEMYVPTAKPAPPDPDLANRYSQLDRQLDAERYNDQLAAWQRRDVQRRSRWQHNQQERSARIQGQLRAHLNALSGVDPSLYRNGAIDQTALERARRCPPLNGAPQPAKR